MRGEEGKAQEGENLNIEKRGLPRMPSPISVDVIPDQDPAIPYLSAHTMIKML